MAKPRVFVSSTYYDLKHVRSSLERFIENLGYEPVLSEKGDIAYSSDQPLDESCYRDAATADMLVLIVGGRFGSEASGGNKKEKKTFFEQYVSVTQKEFETAHGRGIPVFIVVESAILSEYQTYLRNKGNHQIQFAHVDSVNVFRLLEEIYSKPLNNPVFSFERFSEIETWLKEQWAGHFRELLRARSEQKRLVELTSQVGELRALNQTLKTYLEAVMQGVKRDESKKLIQIEEKRLDETKRVEKLRNNEWISFISGNYSIPFDFVVKTMKEASTATEFSERVAEYKPDSIPAIEIIRTLQASKAARFDFNEARSILGMPPLTDWGGPILDAEQISNIPAHPKKRRANAGN